MSGNGLTKESADQFTVEERRSQTLKCGSFLLSLWTGLNPESNALKCPGMDFVASRFAESQSMLVGPLQ